MEGWLTKRGGFVKNWKRRFFRLRVLPAPDLAYYDSELPSAVLKGTIPLALDTVVELQDAASMGQPFPFSVNSCIASRKFFVAAESHQLRATWMLAIEHAAKGLPLDFVQKDANAPSIPREPSIQARARGTVAGGAGAAAVENSSPARSTSSTASSPSSLAFPPASVPVNPAPAPATSTNATTNTAAAASVAPASPPPTRLPNPADEVPRMASHEWRTFREQVSTSMPAAPRLVRVPGVTTTIRVFISSTFVDEHGERDELIRRVFNELNAAFRSRWVNIVPVDLRWGVSHEETTVIQQTCLNELDNCRVHATDAPWFIGLRGERYGWVQDKYDKPADFIRPELFKWMDALRTREQLSITSMEVYHATLGCRRDAESSNLGPHAFMLYRDPAFKKKVDAGMRWVFDFEYLSEDAEVEEAVKHQYTKTPKCSAYFHDLAELNNQLQAPESADVCICAPYYPTFGEPNDGSLVEKTGQLPSGKMFGVGYVGGLSAFGTTVYDLLFAQINKEFPPLPEGTALEIERVQHMATINSRSEFFVGREDLLAKMGAWVTDRDVRRELFANRGQDNLAVAVVSGGAGCGKSALMAQYCKQLTNRSLPSATKLTNELILCHVVGATPASQSLRGMLRRFCQELLAAINKTDTIPENIDELRDFFGRLLADMSRPVVLVIDAVNQLHAADDAHELSWLPTIIGRMSHEVLIIISTLPSKCLDRARALGATELEVPLLEDEDRAALVRGTLGKYHKKLTENDADRFLGNQMALLLKKEEAGSPLFLVAACEELRNFAVYEKMTPFLRDTLPGTVESLFAFLLQRLDGDHGAELVGLALSFVSQSRAGILEMEVIDLLSDWEWETEQRSNFSRLYTGIKMFVTSGGAGLLQLFHQTLLFAVVGRYTPTEDSRIRIHAILASYFRRRADPRGDGAWDGNYPRGLQELCFHLIQSQQWKALEAVMTDIKYIEARCKAGSGYELVSDYISAVTAAPAGALTAAFTAFQRFFLAEVHMLSVYPDQVRVAALRTPYASPVCQAVLALPLDRPLLQLVNKSEAIQVETLSIKPVRFRAHMQTCCDLSPDGSVVLLTSPISEGSSAMLFHASTGVAKKQLCVSASENAFPCAFAPDGKWCAVARQFKDGGLKSYGVTLFDVENGEVVGEHRHPFSVSALRFSPDGKELVFSSASFPRDLVVLSLPSCTVRVSVALKELDDAQDFAVLPDVGELVLLSSEQLKRLKYSDLSVIGPVPVDFHLAQFMAYSHPLKQLAVGGQGNRNVLVILDVAKVFAVLKKITFDPFVECPIPSYSADGSVLAVVLRAFEGSKNMIHLYEGSGNEHKELGKAKTGTTTVNMARISRDGASVVLSATDGYCKLFGVKEIIASSPSSSAAAASFEAIFGHDSTVNFIGLTNNPNIFITSGNDLQTNQAMGRLMAWDVVTGQNVLLTSMGVRRLDILDSFSGEPCMFIKQDGLGVRYKADPQKLIVLSFPDSQRLIEMPVTDTPAEIHSAKFTFDGSHIVMALGEPAHEFRVLDVKTGNVFRRFPTLGEGKGANELRLFRLLCPGMLAAIVKDVPIFGLVNYSTGAHIVDMKLDHFFTELLDIACVLKKPGSADLEQLVLVGCNARELRGSIVFLRPSSPSVWQVHRTITAHNEQATMVRISPDQQFVITTGSDSAVRFWRASDGSPVCTFVDNGQVSSLLLTANPALPTALHCIIGGATGRVSVVRLVHTPDTLLLPAALNESLSRVPDLKLAAKPNRSAASAAVAGGSSSSGGGGSASAAIRHFDLPIADGGGVNVFIDGHQLFPVEQKVMYSQGWGVDDDKISANPTFRMSDWEEDRVGARTAATCSVIPVAEDGQANFGAQFYCMATATWTPETDLVFAPQTIMSGGATFDRLPPGRYMLMIMLVGSLGPSRKMAMVTID